MCLYSSRPFLSTRKGTSHTLSDLVKTSWTKQTTPIRHPRNTLLFRLLTHYGLQSQHFGTIPSYRNNSCVVLSSSLSLTELVRGQKSFHWLPLLPTHSPFLPIFRLVSPWMDMKCPVRPSRTRSRHPYLSLSNFPWGPRKTPCILLDWLTLSLLSFRD